MHFALRLRALDVKYHELGGLYDRLHDSGRLLDVILTPEQVEQASRTPPPGGRARRGAWIRDNREDDSQHRLALRLARLDGTLRRSARPVPAAPRRRCA